MRIICGYRGDRYKGRLFRFTDVNISNKPVHAKWTQELTGGLTEQKSAKSYRLFSRQATSKVSR